MDQEEICTNVHVKEMQTNGTDCLLENEVESTTQFVANTVPVGPANDVLKEPTEPPPRDILQRNSIKDSSYYGLEMREQDADWLEAMHINGGPNRTGMTPLLTSTISQHSMDGENKQPTTFFLSMDGDDTTQQALTFDGVASLRAGPQSPTVKNKNKLVSYLPNNSPKIKSELQQATNDENYVVCGSDAVSAIMDLSDLHMNGTRGNVEDFTSTVRRTSLLATLENSTSVPLIPHRRSIQMSDRPVLSGTIYEEGVSTTAIQNQLNNTLDTLDVDGMASLPLRVVVSLDTPSPGPEHSDMTSKQRDGVRSVCENQHADAKHRRKITEVAQFADAVGDNALDVQIIEDDERGEDVHGDDDDDDDDATEIHINQQQRNVVGGLLPIKMRSSAVLPAELVKNGSMTAARSESGYPTNVVASRIPIPEEFPETPIKLRVMHTQRYDVSTKSLALPSDAMESTIAVADTIATTNSSSPSRTGFLAQLPTSESMCPSHDFVYKGIGANPPEIVKRGTTRGNYAQLHRKAWLEVTDKYHRYGKNLRLYYRYWESEGHPTNIFFDWLDSKGEAAGNELPELKECPRRQLDSDTVLYINNPDVTQGYAINVVVEPLDNLEPDSKYTDGVRRGRMYDTDGNPVCTGPDGWIFVLRDNFMYGAKKITSVSGQSRQRFHHSSFFGGKAVAAAGIFITDDDGYLTRLYPHSGHYRPGEAHMQRVLFYLYHEGVDLRSFEMDTQQIMHVARDGNDTAKDKKSDKNSNAIDKVPTEKKKKVEVLHLMPAVYIACFLAHKARFIGEGIFAQIHQIRQSDVASVSEALSVIDNGGLRRKFRA